MKDIIEVINSMEEIVCGKAVKESEIEQAEKELGLKFSDEYHRYVKNFGCMAIGGREFTGISNLVNYSVITITVAQKHYNTSIPADWYVIEQLNIDGIVIWQATTGEVYQTSPNAEPIKLCNSMAEYINL